MSEDQPRSEQYRRYQMPPDLIGRFDQREARIAQSLREAVRGHRVNQDLYGHTKGLTLTVSQLHQSMLDGGHQGPATVVELLAVALDRLAGHERTDTARGQGIDKPSD